MAFGKKKTASVQFDQSNVATLAADALRTRRSTRVRLAIRVTLGQTLMHRWDEKALHEMLGKMVGLAKVQENKDLTRAYEASYYRNEDGVLVMPCRIVKAAIVAGAISTSGAVTKADLKRDLRVLGHTSPIRLPKGQKMTMDVRLVKNNSGPDVRARALIPAGSTFDVVLEFPTSLSPDKVICAFEAAGASIGLCEWRPDRGGEFGTFSIDVLQEKDIERILLEGSKAEEMWELAPELLRPFNSDGTGLGVPPNDRAKKVIAMVEHVNSQKKRSA